jgi:hypothetical protein
VLFLKLSLLPLMISLALCARMIIRP